jgi:hypothetical protein
MEREVLDLLERGVTALEKLGEDPVIEMQTGPPVCPHCERINPTVRTGEDEGEGPMAGIVYRFQCQHCHKLFYGIPLQWSMCVDLNQAALVIQERADVSGYNA